MNYISPHQQETISLLDKKRVAGGGAHHIKQKNFGNFAPSVPMSSVTESQNEDGSTNGGSSGVPPRPLSKN